MSLDSSDSESRLQVLQQIRVLATALENRDIGRSNAEYQRFVDAIAEACEAFDAPIVGPFELADQFQGEGDWRAAAQIYEQLLANSHCDPIAAFRSNSYLGWIRFQLGRHSDALRHLTAAIGSPVAEGLIPQHRSFLMVTQALNYLEMGSVSQARAVLDRVQSSSESWAADQKPTTHRAWAIIYLLEDNLDAAQSQLDAAFESLLPLADVPWAAGVHADLADCWTVRARLDAARGDLHGSLRAWQEAYRLCEKIAATEHSLFLGNVMQFYKVVSGLSDTYAQLGNTAAAAKARSRGDHLLEQIGMSEEPQN